MYLSYRPMELADARDIMTWKYEDKYSLYSFSNTDEELHELMNGEYFSAVDDKEQLIGYICYGESARVPGGFGIGLYNESDFIDIGLGLKPSWTGRKLGPIFLEKSLEFLKNEFGISKFRLVVAEFNERAIKAYERVGFKRQKEFYSKINANNMLFISMKVDYCNKLF